MSYPGYSSIFTHTMFYKHTYDDFFDNFPKISEDFPEVVRRPDNHFGTLSENFLRLPKISEERPMMFRSYSITFKYFLRDYVIIGNHSSGDLFSNHGDTNILTL